jgi:hypothetical protein
MIFTIARRIVAIVKRRGLSGVGEDRWGKIKGEGATGRSWPESRPSPRRAAWRQSAPISTVS